jgi:hypothetical protein
MFDHVETRGAEAMEAAVLTMVLHRHPAPVHADDLARAFAGDDWEAAVAGLLADGLLHREGALHLASRSSVRVSELLRW